MSTWALSQLTQATVPGAVHRPGNLVSVVRCSEGRRALGTWSLAFCASPHSLRAPPLGPAPRVRAQWAEPA